MREQLRDSCVEDDENFRNFPGITLKYAEQY